MLPTAKRNAVPIVGHRIKEIVQIFRVEDVPNVRKEGIGQPANPAPFADKRVNVIGRWVTLRVDVRFGR